MMFASTPEGKTVRLGDDGRWEFVREIPDLPDQVHVRFSDVPWGAGVADLLRLEQSEPVVVDDNLLEYRIDIAGSTYRLTYGVDDDEGLQMVTYEPEDVLDLDVELDYDREWSVLTRLLAKGLGDPLKVVGAPRVWTPDDLEYWREPSRVVTRRWAVYQNSSTRAIVRLSGTDEWLLNIDLELRQIA